MNLLPLAREPSLLDKAWWAIQYPWDLLRNPFQALLSIPALSFLVIPAFSSYGTTLNLLFFTMTWAILIKSNNPLHVEIIGTFGIRLLFYILPSLAFLAFDSATPALAVGIKEHGHTALPMSAANGGKKGRWWKVVLVSLGNVLFGLAIQTGIELLFTQVLHLQSVLKLSTGLPMPWAIAKDLFLGLLLREVRFVAHVQVLRSATLTNQMMTYIFHRYCLHSKQSALTKMHANWQHTVLAPFSLVAHYDHPITYLIHVFLPTYLPAVLLRFHLLTYLLYLAVVSLEETFAYSGYNVLPSAFVLGGVARRQEKHLMGGGNGNYGCFGLVDFAMGTSVGGDLMDDVIDEAEEKHVGTKTKRKVKAAGKKVTQAAPNQKRVGGEREEEGEGEQRGDVEKEEDEDEDEEEEAPRKLKTKGSSPNKNAKKVAEIHEEDANETFSNGKDETPLKRPSRTRKGNKKSSEEDVEAGGQDRQIKAEEKSRPKAKGVTRKGSQKDKAGNRSRKRSEESDE